MMNTTICHVLPIVMLRESATTPTGTASLSATSRWIKKLASNAAGDNGLVEKEKRTKTRSPGMAVTWTKTLRPNPPKRQRMVLARVTQSRTKKVLFTHSLDPPWLRHRGLLYAPLTPPCQKSASTSDGLKYRCTGAAMIIQSTSQMDIMPWWYAL
jgi:hypothetical protein